MIIAQIGVSKEKLAEYGIYDKSINVGRNVFLYVRTEHKEWGMGYYFGETIPQRKVEARKVIRSCHFLPTECFKNIIVIKDKKYKFEVI